jgi:hypothetical protein
MCHDSVDQDRRKNLFRRIANRAAVSETPENAKRSQTTPKGTEIPVPKRRDFDSLLKRVTGGRAGRKRPAETDPPREQSD